MTRQQQAYTQNRALGNANGAMMGGFGRGQNYLAATQGNFVANSQNMNSYSSGSSIGMLQHGQQERQRGNSNPFEAMTAAAPQLKTLPQTKAENPFAPMMEQSSFPSSGNTVANNAARTSPSLTTLTSLCILTMDGE